MSETDPLPATDDWPFTPTEELDLFLARFYRRDALDEVGAERGVAWFEDHRARDDRQAARSAVVDHVGTDGDLQTVVETVPPDTTGLDWFLGLHHVLTTNEGQPVVTSGPPTARWQAVVGDVEAVAGDSDKLRAFLRGIIDTDRTFHARVHTDFSDAMARASAHHEDDQLWLSNQADVPGQITGIGTTSTGSGRRYRVAAELVPVIETALDRLDAQTAGPVATPDPEVPEELDRRVPKFQEVLDEVAVTTDDVDRFEAILADHDALTYWKDYVAPTVQFRDRAKKAVLCLLASPDDAHGTKGRTNAILYGPPGTGKSAFKHFLVEEFGAYSIDGARVSKADLTYNKNTGRDGLLVRAHRGLAVIEEADELDDDALGAALTALGESGRIEIRDLRLPAEVRGILLGNYRSREEVVAAHSAAVFDRFEFVLEFERLSESERDAAIDWQYDHFRQPKAPGDTDELKRYIAWVRSFDPSVPAGELARIKAFKQDRIDAIENVREGISVLTVAYTIARLNRRDVTLADYKQAFDLVQNGLSSS